MIIILNVKNDLNIATKKEKNGSVEWRQAIPYIQDNIK